MMMGELYTEVSVVFENVRFQRATNIPKDGNLEFIIMIQKGSGNFEVNYYPIFITPFITLVTLTSLKAFFTILTFIYLP